MNPDRHWMNAANLITAVRLLLGAAALVLIQVELAWGSLTAVGLIALIFYLDWVDGKVARMLDVETRFGSTFDILADRIIENAFWITFALRGELSPWVPVIVLLRGFTTWAALRVAEARRGATGGEFAMLHSAAARVIVSSRISRGAYGILKALTFVALAFVGFTAHVAARGSSLSWLIPFATFFVELAMPLVTLTVALCLVRGALILKDGLSRK